MNAQQQQLRDVSHELRSPLARLNVALELAREDGSPENAPYLDRIEQEAHKLNQLIRELLTLSSLEAVDRTPVFEDLSLNDLIEQVVPDAEYEAAQRVGSVSFHADAQYRIRGNSEPALPGD